MPFNSILMVLILSEDLDYVTPRSAAASMGASAESPADTIPSTA